MLTAHQERCKAYYAKNRDRIRAKVKEYRANNTARIREYDAQRRAGNKHRYHAYFLQYKYGITAADYQHMLHNQGGVCAVQGCGNDGSEDKRRRRLFVDHCHQTGKVRGLLCCNCNRVLGMMKESAELLRGLAGYIEKHK